MAQGKEEDLDEILRSISSCAVGGRQEEGFAGIATV